MNLTGEGKVKFIEDRGLFPTSKVIFDTRTDDEERTRWLETRTGTIGGSEIGSIAGYNKYGSALTVFNDKMGIGKKFEGNIHTQYGNRMEPIIREWIQEDFLKATNIKINTYEYPFMMVDKEIEYFSANIDGIGTLEADYTYWENRDTAEIKYIPKDEMFGLEIKTGSEFLTKMWAGEEIPDSYYCQCQWYMGVTGLKYFLIIYMLGKEIKWKVVPRNDEDIKALREIAKDFWENNILQEIPPNPTGNLKETEDINYQQKLSDNNEVNITDGKLIQYQSVSDDIKKLEIKKEQLKQEIFLQMGNNKKGSDGLFKISRFEIKKDKPNLKLLKEKYPTTYADICGEQTEYVSLRITKCK